MNKKNAGFSLVELIVVIAIMAVLVGILAPAYLKYVEKSRKSTDVDAITEIMKAASSVSADVEYEEYTNAGSTFVLTTAANAASVSMTCSQASDGELLAAWKDAANAESYSLKAKAFKKLAGVATGTIQTNGSVTWSQTGDLFGKSNADSMGKYSKDFASMFCS